MMELSVVECPFVQRSMRDEASTTYVSSYEVVADGVLVFEDGILTVYEFSKYHVVRGSYAPAKLVVPLMSVDHMEGRKICSGHLCFEAGRL
jgi:hypothetical protein